VTLAERPESKLAIIFLSWVVMCVLRTFSINRCRGTVSKALFMSMVTSSVRRGGGAG
jgi:hypothetical protein